MPLSLYLIRHGIAEERSDRIADRERCLTDEGRKKTRQVAKKLFDLGLRFDLIQTSPLIRAKQTADIFEDSGFDCPIEISHDLVPEGSFDMWLKWFLQWQKLGKTSLGLVGHEPDLSSWAEFLMWGQVQGALVLKKAGVIGLAIPDEEHPVGNSLMFFLIPPKLLV
jgi:phosphohistidine phosphatase